METIEVYEYIYFLKQLFVTLLNWKRFFDYVVDERVRICYIDYDDDESRREEQFEVYITVR